MTGQRIDGDTVRIVLPARAWIIGTLALLSIACSAVTMHFSAISRVSSLESWRFEETSERRELARRQRINEDRISRLEEKAGVIPKALP